MAPEVEGVVIGPMTEDDIPQAVEIDRLCFTTPWSGMLFFNELKNPRCITFAARSGGRLAGYLCGGLVVDEGHIHNLAVSPDFRGRGIAAALLQTMISTLEEKGARFVYLEVRDSNVEAKRLYSRFGFEVTGVRRDYYTSPVEHASMMVLRLRQQ